MMQSERLKLLVFSITIVMVSCNQEIAEIPSVIEIEDYEIVQRGNEGSIRHNFSDLYIYENEIFLGAYSIPAQVSNIRNGDINLLIFPGIKENGITQTPSIYPMMEAFQGSLSFEDNSERSILPTFGYKSEANFRLIDEFESETTFRVDLDEDPSTTISFEPGFEGYSAKIVLDSAHPLFEVTSVDGKRGFPFDGTPIYLELDYKTDVNLQIGLIAWSNSIAEVKQFRYGIRPKLDWNKIYINLTPEIAGSQLEFYKIVIRAEHDPNLSSSTILLDNIKWIHL